MAEYMSMASSKATKWITKDNNLQFYTSCISLRESLRARTTSEFPKCKKSCDIIDEKGNINGICKIETD